MHDPRLTWNTLDIVADGGGEAVQSKSGHAFIKQVMREVDGVYGGETLILWDPAKKQIVSFYFTTAGFRTEAAFEIKEGKFHSTEMVHGLPGGVTEVSAVSELKDGKFHVKSRRKVNDVWVDGHEVTYREVAGDTPIPVD